MYRKDGLLVSMWTCRVAYAENTEQQAGNRLCRRASVHGFSVWPLELLSNSYFCCLFNPFQIPAGQNSWTCSRYDWRTMGGLFAAQWPQPVNHPLALPAFHTQVSPETRLQELNGATGSPAREGIIFFFLCLQIESDPFSCDIIFFNWYQRYKCKGAIYSEGVKSH